MTLQSCIDLIGRLLPEPHASLLVGLLFGTKTMIPKELYDGLVTTGTLHIIALSGMNISILASIVETVFIPWVGKRVASGLTMMILWLFVWFVGPSPSIVRAAIMGSVSITSGLLGRQYWAILSWGVAVLTMLCVNHAWITDISFQLSAMATLGIILFGTSSKDAGEKTEEKDTHMPTFLAGCLTTVRNLIKEDLRLTASAQLFTIPIILWYFHRISLISPIANILIGWVIAPLTALGWISCFAGFLWFPLGQLMGWGTWVLLEYIVRTIQIMSRIPMASVSL